MHNNQLNRVMRLIRRTGDRCVVLDNESDEAVVVMNLDEYEKILDCDENMCSCCDGDCDHADDDLSNLTPLVEDVPIEDFNSDFCVPEDTQELHAEEAPKTEKIMEKIVTDLPTVEVKDFANVGQEESLEGIPAEEADRFYLEPVDE